MMEIGIPISHFQEQIVFHIEAYGDDHSFNIPLLLELKDPIDQGQFIELVAELESLFPHFRSHLIGDDDGWCLVFNEKRIIPTIGATSGDKRSLKLLVQQFFAIPFDTRSGPLCRVRLINDGPKQYLYIVVHHLVIDGYSLDLLKQTVQNLLRSQRSDRLTSPLCGLPERIVGKVSDKALGEPKSQAKMLHFDFSPAVDLQKAAANLKCTINELVFTAAYKAIKAVKQIDSPIVGVPFGNRLTISDLSNTGCIANIVPINIGAAEFNENALGEVRRSFKEAYQTQHVEFSQRSSGGSALDLLYSFREIDIDEDDNDVFKAYRELEIFKRFDLATPNKAPLSLLLEWRQSKVSGAKKELVFGFEFDTAAYGEADIQQLGNAFSFFLSEALGTDGATHSDSSHFQLSTEEADFKNFEANVSIREVDEKGTVNFYDIDAVKTRTNYWKQQLCDLGATCVIIDAQKSVDVICLIYACYEMSICYAPIDKDLPDSRKRAIQDQIGADVLATGEANLALQKLATYHRATLPDDSQYVIFTSGSTGIPKGVVVGRRELQRMTIGMAKALGLVSHCSAVSYANFYFDMSVPDIYLPYALGGEVTLISDSVKTRPALLCALTEAIGPDLLQVTPTALSLFKDAHLRALAVRHLVLGGESVPKRYNATLFPRVGKLWNFYGPTEGVVWCALGEITEAKYTDLERALPGYKIQIRNGDQKCHAYEVGEIYVGGNLSLGYLDLSHTEDKFRADSEGCRWYSTGDFGFFTTEKEIKVIGRADGQFKHNGVRIELGDIESALLSVQGVRDALAYFDPERALIGALLIADRELSKSETSSQLKNFLPKAMLPTELTYVSRFPESRNGKKSRNLKELLSLAASSNVAFNPANESQSVRARQVVAELLSLHLGANIMDQLDRSFSQLGGTSLKAIAITKSLRTKGFNASPLSLLENNTVGEYLNSLTGALRETV